MTKEQVREQAETTAVILMECIACNPATSGYNRVNVAGQFAHYAPCEVCNVPGGVPGCVRREIKLPIEQGVFEELAQPWGAPLMSVKAVERAMDGEQ